jgi:hypothetical protein
MLRPKPSIRTSQDRAKTVLEMCAATHLLTSASEEQTGTQRFN